MAVVAAAALPSVIEGLVAVVKSSSNNSVGEGIIVVRIVNIQSTFPRPNELYEPEGICSALKPAQNEHYLHRNSIPKTMGSATLAGQAEKGAAFLSL